jgi:Putative Actinobacterial Holin-X, holin superfamily III
MATNQPGPPEPIIPTRANENVAKEVVILPEQTVPTLVRSIIADAQHLIGQQLAMCWQEIRDDIRKNKPAILLVAMAIGVGVGGSGLLLLMIPLLLNWAIPTLPLWACFGAVGGVLVAVAGIVLYVGIRKIKSFDLLSNQAVEAFKENLSWKTKPT